MLPLVLVPVVGCARHKTISRPPTISEREKNEQVFETNEDAVKAGIYEEFVDSMLLKGRSAESVSPESVSRVETPARETQGPLVPEVIMGFRVQLGAFVDQESAERFADIARGRLDSYAVYLRYYHPLWKIHVGDCATREEAERLRDILRRRGYPDAWVTESGIKR